MAYVVVRCNADGYFAASELDRMFDALRVPRPSNTRTVLARVKDRGLALQRTLDRKWTLTPLGDRTAANILTDLDPTLIGPEIVGEPGVLFGDVRHSVIPPVFAPSRWAPAIKRLLDRFPFENNVFCMTRFPRMGNDSESVDPVGPVVETLRTSLRLHGLLLHLASDRQIDDELLGNVGAYMWACQYGIGLLENRADSRLNYYVVIELGAMLMTGRRCMMLKDRTAPELPTDLSGHIYKSVDFDDPQAIAATAHLWAAEDLGLGRCPKCPASSAA